VVVYLLKWWLNVIGLENCLAFLYFSDKLVSVGARFTNMGFPLDSSYLDVETVMY
jgi:hypothetical protein